MAHIYYVLFILTLFPFVLTWMTAYVRFKQLGKIDNRNPRGQYAELKGLGARLVAAQNNCWEALIIFVAVTFIAYANNVDMHQFDTIAWVYLALRVLFVICYAKGLGLIRSLVFVASMLCCLYIATSAF
jgi:uncharacterized MAPEG superfamily protein